METSQTNPAPNTITILTTSRIRFNMDHSDMLNRDLPQWQNVLFGVAAFLAAVSNLFLCVIIIKGKNLSFCKSDILLLFNIAIAGLLTGIFTAITPPLVTQATTLTGFAATVYCKLLASWFLIVFLAKVSIMTCMFLAIDQWFILCRPEQHQITFGRQRVKTFIWFTWIIGAVTAITLVFSFENNGESCDTTPLFGMGFQTQQAIILVQTFVTVFLPCLITWVAIGASLRQRKNFQVQASQKDSAKKLLMYSTVVLTLTLSWFFQEISAIVQGHSPGSNVRHYARMLALCTPCLIPCICFTMSEELRKQVKLLFLRPGREEEEENSTTDNPKEGHAGQNTALKSTVVSPEEEDETKNTMKKQYSFEQENALNQEKDCRQENLITENHYESIDLSKENKQQPLLVPLQLAVGRESCQSFDVMESERSPSGARYVKRGEMSKIAIIW